MSDLTHAQWRAAIVDFPEVTNLRVTFASTLDRNPFSVKSVCVSSVEVIISQHTCEHTLEKNLSLVMFVDASLLVVMKRKDMQRFI